VTVGETLTEARNQAGLSVEEVSERTSIRDTVIRGIEHDDYAACGGDRYVRGYVRAIAGAVGLDARPLIREYDEGQGDDPGQAEDLRAADGHAPGPDPGLDEPALTASGRHALSYPRSDPGPAGDPDRTRFDLPAVPADPAPTAFDLPALSADGLPPATAVTGDLMAAGYDLSPTAPTAPMAPIAWAAPAAPAAPSAWGASPAAGATPAPPPWITSPASPAWGAPPARPAGTAPPAPPAWGAPPAPPAWTAPPAPAAWTTAPVPAGPAGDPRRKRHVLVAAAVVVVLLAAGGFLGVRLASDGTPRSTAAASPQAKAQPAAAGAGAAAGASSVPARGSASGQATAGTTAGAAATLPLPVASAAAFGPHGTADGDNQAQAGEALSGQASSSWPTQWYATAKFGGLKSGTGLLLDLGSTASVSSVKLVLSPAPGATVQLRVGSRASLADLRTAKTARGAGGTVRLTFTVPVRTRYLLIWFTQLAPDGAGHYAETVSHVLVKGHS
jgi:transcriptional regulator with XRE-family HTH domain